MSLSTKLDIRDKCLDQPAPIAAPYMSTGDFWDVATVDKHGKPVLFRHSDPTISLKDFMLSQGMRFDKALVWFRGKLVED